jgi:spermidine synthase
MAAPIRLDESLTATSGAYVEATELLAAHQSPFQLIEIFDTPDLGRLMRLDSANMTSTRDEFFYHENLIHPAAITHPNPTTALIIGGGDGGAAEELLKYSSIVSCDVCELDGAVIDMAKTYLPEIHRGAFADPRLHVTIGDGLAFVNNIAARYDLIYLDLTDPTDEAAALYTENFYRDCQRALNRDGALTLHIGSPFSHPDRVCAAIANLGAVFEHVVPYFVHIPSYGATWGFALASDASHIRSCTAAEIDHRLASRQITGRQFYNGNMHHAMMCLPEYVKQLL